MSAPIGRGTKKELQLARRAIATARCHLQRVRQGVTGEPDALVLRVLIQLHDLRLELATLTKRKSVVRHARAA